jgi:glycosyltransferase involved in cell wall biosynthesis
VVNQDVVHDLLRTADVGLVLLHPTGSHLRCLSTKLYEYMAAGLPVVGPRFDGWPQVVEQIGCGLLVNPLDPQQLAEAVRFLLENPELANGMGLRGRAYALAHCSWSGESEKLIASYDRLIS